MSFRANEDALAAERAALDQALQAAIEREESTEDAAEAAQREVAEIRAQLARLELKRGEASSKRPAILTIVGIAAITLGLVATLFVRAEPAHEASGSSESATTVSEPPDVAADLNPALALERSDLPDTPSRNDVARALASARGAVGRCAPGVAARVVAHTTFERDGTVVNVRVSTSPDVLDDDARQCLRDAIRRVRVPPFRRATFMVNYPFLLSD